MCFRTGKISYGTPTWRSILKCSIWPRHGYSTNTNFETVMFEVLKTFTHIICINTMMILRMHHVEEFVLESERVISLYSCYGHEWLKRGLTFHLPDETGKNIESKEHNIRDMMVILGQYINKQTNKTRIQ